MFEKMPDQVRMSPEGTVRYNLLLKEKTHLHFKSVRSDLQVLLKRHSVAVGFMQICVVFSRSHFKISLYCSCIVSKPLAALLCVL